MSNCYKKKIVMKRVLLSVLIVILSLLTSCSKESENSNNTVKISGFVKSSNNIPEENVKVSILNFENLTKYTDSEGYFEIEGVVKGKHDLTLLKNNVNSNSEVFVQRTLSVTANEDTNLNALLLPNPVILNPASEITSSSALLSWNKSTDNSFREYKLYRHNSSGIDEKTGTLVHVTTDINKISFFNNGLNNSETYFYRVFVSDEFGSIGGSNIINFKTQSIQVVKNGSFENLTNNLPDNWSLEANDFGNPKNTITIDNTDATDGLNSIKIYHAEEKGCFEQWIKQSIEDNVLIEGAKYKLTFDYKSDFSSANSLVNLVLRNWNNTLSEWYRIDLTFINDGQWRSVNFEFTLPSKFDNANIKLMTHFCVYAKGNYWIDNLHMERIK